MQEMNVTDGIYTESVMFTSSITVYCHTWLFEKHYHYFHCRFLFLSSLQLMPALSQSTTTGEEQTKQMIIVMKTAAMNNTALCYVQYMQ